MWPHYYLSPVASCSSSCTNPSTFTGTSALLTRVETECSLGANNQRVPQNQIQILQPPLWLKLVSISPFLWVGWILHFLSLVHTSVQFNQWFWKAIGGGQRQTAVNETHRTVASQSRVGRASIMGSAFVSANRVGGWAYSVSSEIPAPHSALSRVTQVLAKERENRGSPKTDKKTLKCYSEGSLWLKTKLSVFKLNVTVICNHTGYNSRNESKIRVFLVTCNVSS